MYVENISKFENQIYPNVFFIIKIHGIKYEHNK